MNWDENWMRALATVLAAVVGAIAVTLLNAFVASKKIKEIELQYQFKLNDTYTENARSVAKDVYIPIIIEITRLSMSYDKFSTMVGTSQQGSFRDDFVSGCVRFLDSMDRLFARGAEAYLTTHVDIRLNELLSFLRSSLDSSDVIKRRVLRVKSALPGVQDLARERTTRGAHLFDRFGSSLWVGAMGFGFSYQETVLAAPVDSSEFEARFRTDSTGLKAAVKEVTLGATGR
jgi:hypothetical protein